MAFVVTWLLSVGSNSAIFTAGGTSVVNVGSRVTRVAIFLTMHREMSWGKLYILWLITYLIICSLNYSFLFINMIFTVIYNIPFEQSKWESTWFIDIWYRKCNSPTWQSSQVLVSKLYCPALHCWQLMEPAWGWMKPPGQSSHVAAPGGCTFRENSFWNKSKIFN